MGRGGSGRSASPAPPPPRPAPPPQRRLLRKSRACHSNRLRKSHPPHRPLDVSARSGASDWRAALSATSRGLRRAVEVGVAAGRLFFADLRRP